jgi:hypothetical protein
MLNIRAFEPDPVNAFSGKSIVKLVDRCFRQSQIEEFEGLRLSLFLLVNTVLEPFVWFTIRELKFDTTFISTSCLLDSTGFLFIGLVSVKLHMYHIILEFNIKFSSFVPGVDYDHSV